MITVKLTATQAKAAANACSDRIYNIYEDATTYTVRYEPYVRPLKAWEKTEVHRLSLAADKLWAALDITHLKLIDTHHV